MKHKAVIGIGIVLLSLLVVVPQSAYAQPCTTNIIPHVYNETGYDMDGAFVEWINNDTGEPIGNCTTFPTGSCFMTHTWIPDPGPFDSLIRASKPCYTSNSTVIENTDCSMTGKFYYVTLILGKDEAGPTITNLQPANGSFINNTTPAICANYSDPSGINVSSAKMLVDSIDVTATATVRKDYICYTSITALPDGLHNVTVNVSDNCTNSNSISWSFTVDTIAPTIEFIPPTPANKSLNTTGCVNVTVNVTDPIPGSGLEDVINVSVWNETGIYLNNKTMQAFDEHKYYYNVFSPDGAPLPDGNYTYKVYAKDVAGNTGESETRVVTVNVTEYTVNITLESGWNMFGVPLALSNYTLPTGISSIEGKYECVGYYNATIPGMQYYFPAHPGWSTLKELEPGAGYWINMTDYCNLTFEGKKFCELSRDLENGWDMFSVPYGIANKTLPSALSSIDSKYECVGYYNATIPGMQYYFPAHPGWSTLKELEPGAGYWINMTEAAIFEPDIK